MALYSIQDTTLTGIGDALRRRHGETKIATVTEQQTVPKEQDVFKSNNATGFGTFNGEMLDFDSMVLPAHEQLKVISIPSAATIKIKYWRTKQIGICAVDGEVESIDPSKDTLITPWETWGNSAKDITSEFTTNSNVVTFYAAGNVGGTDVGYYVECIGFDTEGNPLETKVINVEVEKEVENKYKPTEMAAAIDAISSAPPEDVFVITGSCDHRFYGGKWDWFIEQYANKITTKSITNASYMFYGSNISEIPFEINFDTDGADCDFMFGLTNQLQSVPSINFKQFDKYKVDSSLFQGCYAKEIGTIRFLFPSNISKIFYMCSYLRELPEFVSLKMTYIQTNKHSYSSEMFYGCYSLRSIPENFLKSFYGIWETPYGCFLYNAFYQCASLDEIKGLIPKTGTTTGNIFGYTFQYCCRVKNITFALQDDGTPYAVNWKNQVMNLTTSLGWAPSSTTGKGYILNYNSGITDDKEVTDDATYQALKNDPDWFTCDSTYSRYNHDSAVATINSLPDTSAYLATAGGTNTIKFNGAAGSATDGGAINTLTEAEVAVAAAKGWTCSY